MDVACAAAAAAVLIIPLKHLQSPAVAEEQLLRVWKCNGASRLNFVDFRQINI